jgi:hypothetical protein
MKLAQVLPALLTLTACVTNISPGAMALREASPDTGELARCAFLGTFQGNSNYGGMAADTGAKEASAEALNAASAAGATHFVWAPVQPGAGTSAAVRGYACPQTGGGPVTGGK